MGHLRMGRLPKTRRWTQVVDLLDAGSLKILKWTNGWNHTSAQEFRFTLMEGDPVGIRAAPVAAGENSRDATADE